MTDEPAKCPRCEGPLLLDPEDPDDEPYVAAFSESIDGSPLEVCLECSADEAVRFVFSGELVPPHEWPIREGAHDQTRTYALDPDRD